MSKILSFFKNLDIMAVGLAGAIVLVLALSVFSYVLMSANENLAKKIKELEIDREQMSGFIHNQQTAINELEANLSEKENLSCEITAQKSKIIAKGAKNEVDNTAINSAVSFVYSRLREQNATK